LYLHSDGNESDKILGGQMATPMAHTKHFDGDLNLPQLNEHKQKRERQTTTSPT
jgi:hypothetical protein